MCQRHSWIPIYDYEEKPGYRCVRLYAMTYLCFTCVYVWRYTCMSMLIGICVKTVHVTSACSYPQPCAYPSLWGGVSEGGMVYVPSPLAQSPNHSSLAA